MQLEFIPAPGALEPWALGVSVVRSEQAVRLAVPAHALAITTVVLEGSLWQMAEGGQRIPMPRMFSTGSATRAQVYVSDGALVCASLLCVASVLPLLLGNDAARWVNRRIADDALGVDARLAGVAHDSNAVIAAGLLAGLQGRLAQLEVPPAARVFLAALAGWDGVTGAPQGWHARRWQRACKAQLGLTPKLLQRLVRLHRSARQTLADASGPLFRWSEHALDAGYADQPHLLKDYRELAGVRPPRPSPTGVQSPWQPLKVGAEVLAPRLIHRT